jgi:predicted acyl esterase
VHARTFIHTATAAAALALTGCSSYGFTSTRAAAQAPEAARAVAVATVAAPAHEGVDHGAITRALVDAASACSGRGARWGAATSPGEVTLDCHAASILGEVRGRAIDASVTAECTASMGAARATRQASARAGAQSPTQGQAAARAHLVSLALGDASRRAGCDAILDLWNQLDTE